MLRPARTRRSRVNEDQAYTLTVADFGFTDPQDTPADAFQAVRVTTLPTNGSLTLNGLPVAAGQLVLVSDITLGKLLFTGAANASGSPLAASRSR